MLFDFPPMSVFPAVRLVKVPSHSGLPQYRRYGGEGMVEVQHPLRGLTVLRNGGAWFIKNETKREKKQGEVSLVQLTQVIKHPVNVSQRQHSGPLLGRSEKKPQKKKKAR